MKTQLIYIVEDDENIRDIVGYALRSAGFETVGFEGGADFWEAFAATAPDLILLDIMLPGDDGMVILKQLRNKSKTIPVIMLTAKGGEYDKVKGLDSGADDYITKPFGVMELLSRVNAVLRRSGLQGEVQREVCGIAVDDARRTVTVGGQKITLTYKEYELLHYLFINAGLALTRDRIMETVWGWDFEGESRTLDMHIRSLRQKLGEAGAHIQTVRNVGYRLGE